MNRALLTIAGLLALAACDARPQTPLATVRVDPADSLVQVIIPHAPDSGLLLALRDSLTKCSGEAWPGEVKVFVRTPGALLHGDLLLGEWVAPDTVFLDPIVLTDSTQYRWVLMHELLHHVLRGPKTAHHPPARFIPCGVHMAQAPKWESR